MSRDPLERLAFEIYAEFARVPLEQAEYRWAKTVRPKVKEQFREEAREMLRQDRRHA
jgi:hypothetical protein